MIQKGVEDYRPEIDGLRAFSVLLVVVFHLNPKWLPGGYIGVDIFFVISGYLITSQIIHQMQMGRFRLSTFYERRVRRIFPALWLTVTSTLIVGQIALFPYELLELSNSALASLLAISNFYFWFTVDYFDKEATLRPLLHTWSLGVEEQFYLFFPIFVLILWRSRVSLMWVISGCAFMSFFIAQAGGNLNFSYPYLETPLSVFSQPSWASFYLPFGRAWELLVGSMLALNKVNLRDSEASTLVHDFCAFAGLSLICASAYWYDETTGFPNFFTMLPICGACLVIIFSTKRTILGKLLSKREIVGIGLISFSIYLWHIPILAMSQVYMSQHPPLLSRLLIIAVIFTLSYLSWRYVEKPFRDTDRVSAPKLWWSVLLATSATACLCFLIITTNGLPSRFSKSDLDLVSKSPDQHGEYVRSKFALFDDKTFTKTDRRKILIIGDSYAQDFVNMIFESPFGEEHGTSFEIVTVYVSGICQIHFVEEDLANRIPSANRESCENDTSIASSMHHIRNADLIVLAASWKSWAAEKIHETIENMNLSDNQEVLVVGSKYFGNINTRKLVGMPLAQKIKVQNKINLEVNLILAKNLDHKIFLDPMSMFCDASNFCPVFSKEGELISFDGGHLTKAGARFLGSKLYQNKRLRELIVLNQSNKTP